MSFEETFDGVDKVLDAIASEHEATKKKTIIEIIRYGRHLDKVRKENPDVISSRDVLKTLIEHGMPLSLAIQLQKAIDNPTAEITFK